ncbi:MAG: ribonuclease II, partial [Prochlorococcaceae cyanobacterium]
MAVVLSVQGTKLQLAVGWSAKLLILPRRDVQPICPLPPAASPPPRLGVTPWAFSQEDLASVLPGRRDLGSAWWLLGEASGDEVSLASWCDLVLGGQDPPQLAAGWLWLQGPQLLFRLRPSGITPR